MLSWIPPKSFPIFFSTWLHGIQLSTSLDMESTLLDMESTLPDIESILPDMVSIL